MRICRDYNVKMREVMSFSKDENEKFNRYFNCYGEAVNKRLKKNDFGKILEREIHNRK